MRHIARSRTSKSTSWLCSHFEMWVVVGVGGLYAGNPISRMSFVRREEGVDFETFAEGGSFRVTRGVGGMISFFPQWTVRICSQALIRLN